MSPGQADEHRHPAGLRRRADVPPLKGLEGVRRRGGACRPALRRQADRCAGKHGCGQAGGEDDRRQGKEGSRLHGHSVPSFSPVGPAGGMAARSPRRIFSGTANTVPCLAPGGISNSAPRPVQVFRSRDFTPSYRFLGVRIEEHQQVPACPEGRRAFDPVLLGYRLRGEDVRAEGVVRHGDPDVLARLRAQRLVLQEHQVSGAVPDNRGVDHVESRIEKELRPAVLLEVARRCPVDPMIEGHAFLVLAAGVVRRGEPAGNRGGPEDQVLAGFLVEDDLGRPRVGGLALVDHDGQEGRLAPGDQVLRVGDADALLIPARRPHGVEGAIRAEGDARVARSACRRRWA